MKNIDRRIVDGDRNTQKFHNIITLSENTSINLSVTNGVVNKDGHPTAITNGSLLPQECVAG
jgi:hypothetical protein